MLFHSGDDNYTIRYSKPVGLVELIWHGAVSSDQFQVALSHIIEVLKEDQVKFFLIDAKRLNPFRAKDQTWLKKHFFPKLNETQVIKFARITEPDLFTQAVVGDLVQYVHHNKSFKFNIHSFYERDEALEWLLNEVLVD
ncbi:hypothetical protein ACFSKU_04015 [Pontibacter silvestris]|uniref:STAS/SEC14 domain-containing protein n=1 Tax=Pontibacter silvestris TaxID=2305183 RepID=A0ABW4WV55_9BACT|nr:hypothetical protein [Pontibacter silvestris]MCC9137970.1 hypothetical protein [Pontibacter silvestris]